MDETRSHSTAVPDDAAPSADVIDARHELGSGEYHEHCCPWVLWADDKRLFTAMPDCDCGGPGMAKAYPLLLRFVEMVAAGGAVDDLQGEASYVLAQAGPIWPDGGA